MPAPKRPRRERTHDWGKIKQWTLWPEQQVYEHLRPKSRPLTRSRPSHLVVYVGAHTHKE